ncbi:SAP domain-containing protein [Microbacterium lacus]|uniref:SAP domain-containing protein n=1 Tax=Microbacterium lacus TaxID=415217 RepID=UPI000C2CD26D|nr:SAP domain-containing protein [Microbacterium lacus]
MTTIIKHVSARHPETMELVNFVPGDELPKWAESVITNPVVLGEYNVPDDGAGAAGSSDDTTGEKPLDKMSSAELKALAKTVGAPQTGNKKALIEAITAKRAEAAKATDESSDDSASGETDERGTLVAKAKELGLEVTDETTDVELQALIENATQE